MSLRASVDGTLPIPSPQCQVQVGPVGPGSVAFMTSPAGDAGVTLPLPAGLQPMDAFLQMGAIDGNSFVVSNPMQMHLR